MARCHARAAVVAVSFRSRLASEPWATLPLRRPSRPSPLAAPQLHYGAPTSPPRLPRRRGGPLVDLPQPTTRRLCVSASRSGPPHPFPVPPARGGAPNRTLCSPSPLFLPPAQPPPHQRSCNSDFSVAPPRPTAGRQHPGLVDAATRAGRRGGHPPAPPHASRVSRLHRRPWGRQ